jgi:hypothetical protein
MEELQGEVIGPVRLRLPYGEDTTWLEDQEPSCGTFCRWQRGRGNDGGRELVLRMQASFFVLRLGRGYPTPGVFWRKSSEIVENKGPRVRKVVKSLEVIENREVAHFGAGCA